IAKAAAEADQGDGVVVLTISQRMSSVYQAAGVAAKILEGEKVSVVDTGTAAGAEGLVVLAASKAARQGRPLDEVVAAANVALRSTKLVATLPSLAHLARSGRVPGAAAWGAQWLGLSPLFEFRSGRVWPLRPARGLRSATQRMVSEVAREARRQDGAHLHVAALHALEPGMAAALVDQVSGRVPLASSFLGSFTAVMVAHTGPGLLGLAWRWEQPGSEQVP
ncbi:MAG TPA: DegV family protein, partial [Acidimicrobiales bacterium]|nr:DegV family protein [Acidimicrobiales bacterium]